MRLDDQRESDNLEDRRGGGGGIGRGGLGLGGIVLVLVIVFGLILWLLDTVLSWFVSSVIG